MDVHGERYERPPTETNLMQATLSAPALNGTPTSAKAKRTTSKSSPATTKARKSKVVLSARRRMAVGVGSVGIAVLLLSVYHCTEAISLLTGSPILLAALLAVGIDCGMVVTEMAAIIAAHDKVPNCRRWANAYIVAAVLLSMLLNSVASGLHAEQFKLLAYSVGAIIPVLVFILGKVAGLLWEE
jgi:hypothetical protein